MSAPHSKLEPGQRQQHKRVEIQLGLRRRRLADRDMHIELTTRAVDKLADSAFDPAHGALPLRRAIASGSESLGAADLLGKFSPGETIQIDANDRGIECQKTPDHCIIRDAENACLFVLCLDAETC